MKTAVKRSSDSCYEKLVRRYGGVINYESCIVEILNYLKENGTTHREDEYRTAERALSTINGSIGSYSGSLKKMTF